MSEAPETDRLGRSAEDYLEAIGELCGQHGHAQVSSIAERLGVRKPSVTAALRKLSAEELITYAPYAPVVLTEKGQEYASRVMSAHRTLRRFMQEVAGLTPERADETACLMEHILTTEEIAAIASRLP